MTDPIPATHVPHFGCPETPAHAEQHTPIYDDAAFAAGFAPMPTVEQVRAEYDAQVRSGHARGGA